MIYFIFILLQLINFLILVESKSYLLIPKTNNFNINFLNIPKKHSIKLHAKLNKLTVFKISEEMYNLHSKQFNDLFEIEQDDVVTLPKPIINPSNFFNKQQNLNYFISEPWHLSRISQRKLPLRNSFKFSNPGSCHSGNTTIHTYIVDTGIDVSHPEFEGRATWLENFTDDNVNDDCNNHGTHCAGLVGSKSFGVCKDANLFAVKVLDCGGSGSYSGIISGLQYVYNRHLSELSKNPNLKTIISMSLGGGYSRTINQVVEELIKINSIYVVVASGNSNADACNFSPASSEGILSIMASNNKDNRAYFSNYGDCTDIYSPGVDILSTIPNNNTAVYSGTSMATPIVAGVLNHYLDMFPYLNMKQLKRKLLRDSSKNRIQNNPSDTNNFLIYLNR